MTGVSEGVQAEGVTLELCSWAAELDPAQLDGAVVARTKLHILDHLRVVFAGARMPWSIRIADATRSLGAPGTVQVPCTGDRLDGSRAAYLTGCYAHALDLDDTHIGSMFHPGATVTSAALAAGQMADASGTEAIAAIMAAYEVSIRLSYAIQPAHFERGFQSTGTCGAIGAAVACGRLFGLDAERLAHAVGIAASYSGGLAQFYISGSDVKRTHAGRAAEGGLLAAHLARHGLSGPVDILEGRLGFARAFAGVDLDSSIMDDLGDSLALFEVVTKLHPASARIQAAIDAGLAIGRELDGHLDEVEEISVGVPSVIMGRLTENNSSSLQAAQMSVPFSVALALVQGAGDAPPSVLTIDDYQRGLRDERVMALAARVRCHVDERVEEEHLRSRAGSVGALVKVRRAGGETSERRVGGVGQGEERSNGPTEQAVVEAFRREASPDLDLERQEHLLAVWRRFEQPDARVTSLVQASVPTEGNA